MSIFFKANLFLFAFNLVLPLKIYSQATLLRQPYLNSVTQNSIVVRWRTDLPTSSKVSFGLDLSYGQVVMNSSMVTEHEVLLIDLQPFTKYYYTIGSDTQVLQGDSENYFYTAKPANSMNSTFRVWVTGDFGVGSSNQILVKNAYKNYVGNSPANFWIWLGDNAYSNGTDLEYTNNVFTQYPEILKNTPIYPSIGNHDYGGVGYLSGAAATNNFTYFQQFTLPINGEAGGVPSGTEKYYSYNYGNVHFVVLDSYGAPSSNTSPMYLWLKNDLEQNLLKWTVCYFHHPPYTKGTHDSDSEIELIKIRENIIPLLESKNVDLVLAGHSHVYERSYMINGHYGQASTFNESMKRENLCEPNELVFKKNTPLNASIYVVCGVSGQGGAVSVTNTWPHQAMVVSDKTKFGSMVLDFQKDTLSSKFITSTGTVFDSFKIVKPDKCTDVSISTSKTSGDWNLGNTWECGIIPTAGSCVFIQPGHVVTIPKSATVEVKKMFLNGQILQNGTLKFSN
jgi:hypothetical protein